MSRVAKKVIIVPKGVDVSVKDGVISVKGPKGLLTLVKPSHIDIVANGAEIKVDVKNGDTAMGGTIRALVQNCIIGVDKGYERKLELVGVGFRVAMAGKDLNLTIGFSHPVVFKGLDGISLETPTPTEIMIKGADKQRVGEVAAKIRAFRPPEPYKGKGIRYGGEKITLKEVKKA
jgi:large subunit ribosomal protein L6